MRLRPALLRDRAGAPGADRGARSGRRASLRLGALRGVRGQPDDRAAGRAGADAGGARRADPRPRHVRRGAVHAPAGGQSAQLHDRDATPEACSELAPPRAAPEARDAGRGGSAQAEAGRAGDRDPAAAARRRTADRRRDGRAPRGVRGGGARRGSRFGLAPRDALRGRVRADPRARHPPRRGGDGRRRRRARRPGRRAAPRRAAADRGRAGATARVDGVALRGNRYGLHVDFDVDRPPK